MLKKALVLGAIVALMPTDAAQQQRLYEQIDSASRWTLTFCDRNVAACEQGRGMWQTFVAKAEFGASALYKLVETHVAGRFGTMASQGPQAHPTAAPAGRADGTLTPDDLRPKWQLRPLDGTLRGT